MADRPFRSDRSTRRRASASGRGSSSWSSCGRRRLRGRPRPARRSPTRVPRRSAGAPMAGPRRLSPRWAPSSLLGLWLSVLRGLGARVPPRARPGGSSSSASWGKYLPGLVWPALVQMEAGPRWGVRQSASMLHGNLLMIAGPDRCPGVVIGLVLLPWVSAGLAGCRWSGGVGIPARPGSWWSSASGRGAAHRRSSTAGLRPSSPGLPPTSLRLASPTRRWRVSFAWAFADLAACYGVHSCGSWSGAAGGSGADAWVAPPSAGIALAWALGLVAVFAPAGIGVP